MVSTDPSKQHLIINDVGHHSENGWVIEVHSRGGSLLGLKKLIDDFCEVKSYKIRAVYSNKLGVSLLEVIFPDENAQEITDRLDHFLANRSDYRLQGYFNDSLNATIETIKQQ